MTTKNGDPRFARVQSEDETVLHVDLVGDPSQQALVFLHGGWETPYCFLSQDSLADRFYLVKPHLRGHGLSQKPQELSSYHSRCFAADLFAVITELGLRRPVVVVNSYSGLVLFDYLARYGPDALGGIVFACAIPPDLGEQTAGRYFSPAVLSLMAGFLSGDDDAVDKFVDLLTANVLPGGSTFGEILKDNLLTPAYVRANILLRASPPLQTNTAGTPPVLIVQGEKDKGLMPQACVAALQAIMPHAQVVWFPNSGHFPFLEQPDHFNATLRRFVERVLALQ